MSERDFWALLTPPSSRMDARGDFGDRTNDERAELTAYRVSLFTPLVKTWNRAPVPAAGPRNIGSWNAPRATSRR